MIPPGLGFVSVSDKAWKAYETATLPKFYLDLAAYKKANAKNSSPFTPPINLMFGLKAALEMMRAEGLENIFARHQRLTEITRQGVKELGLPLFADDNCAALAVTAVIPYKQDAEAIRSTMRNKYDIALAGGQDHLKGKIFRIGHLGFVSEADILKGLAALKETLSQVG